MQLLFCQRIRSIALPHIRIEAAAHVRVQAAVDLAAAEGRMPEPASRELIAWLHHEFYRDAPEEALIMRGKHREFVMVPGAFRSQPEHDVSVGRHHPPSSRRVVDCMDYFAERYRFDRMGKAARIIAIASAHIASISSIPSPTATAASAG